MPTTEQAVRDGGARHILPLSGGKDSTALAVYMLRRFPDTRFELVFSDTGAELPETYQYLARFEAILGVPIIRVTALDLLGVRAKAGRTPFDVVLHEHYGGFLPSPQARWCTRMLKIKPFERYVGADPAYSYLGIRADERRSGYLPGRKPVLISDRPNILPVYPFKDARIGLAEVKALLEESGLGLPPYYEWRTRSGCYFCFYQQIGEWQGLKEHHPELFERAKAYEKAENGRTYTWVDGRSLTDVEKLARRHEIPSAEDLDGCAICHL
ncbi:MAG: phosphoadenosine phosphosulfate reductase family protein [Candidatus Schekmanbacteria bacterium]|nr:phosphoadenosine phosphosulfate reductase family protein [Candidatus Schekmanbacteria bacterium]